MKKLVELFFELLKISALVIGGGYAIIAVADEVFAKKGWTEEGELLDRLPVFQTIPGLIATHTAVYLGRKVAGPVGAVVGVIAVALPAVAVFTFVAAGYTALPLDNPWLQAAFTGLRAALTGIIGATILRGWRRNLDSAFAYALMLAAVFAIGVLQVNVALTLVVAMAIGVAAEYGRQAYDRKRGKIFRSSLLPLLLFLKYGALCFGGGFVLVPMYLQDFVGAAAPWLQLGSDEFSNIMALSQMTPGPIGVNGATFFGYRFAGVGGALAASALLLAPGSLAAYFVLQSLEKFRTSRVVRGLMRGVRPASTALMLVAFFAFLSLSVFPSGGSVRHGVVSAALMIFSALAVLKKKLNVIAVIWLCALFALVLRFL